MEQKELKNSTRIGNSNLSVARETAHNGIATRPVSSDGDKKIVKLNKLFESSGPERILEWATEQYGDDVVLSTGFGSSGIVLMHQLSLIKPGATAFYLDTDLLFEETYELIERIRERLNLRLVKVQTPVSVEEQSRQYGDKLWENRPDLCCYIRKVLPLRKFLKDKKAWITGIRRDQSESRSNIELFQHDEAFDVLKINPLASWSEDEVWNYIHINELPYNELHDKGYPSIGCWPCTRAVNEGEDLRAGRWSGKMKTECGIHGK